MSLRHEAALDQVSGSDGLKTGYTTLDRALDVIVRGELCIIAGPPTGGKTTFALNLVLNNAGTRTVWVTPDESHGFLVKKLVCAEFNVTQQQLLAFRKGNRKKVSMFLDDAEAWLHVTDEANPKRLEQIMEETVKEWDGERPQLLVFDYAKLLGLGERFNDTTSKIAWLKAFAKLSQLHVVVIHQALKASIDPIWVNRHGDKEAFRPQISDLSEAGPAEAFQILWMRRTPVLTDDDADRERHRPSAELWILKNKIQSDLPMEPFRFLISPGGRFREASKKKAT